MVLLRKISVFFILLVALSLSACSVSTAGDVTPPPGIEQEAPLAVTDEIAQPGNAAVPDAETTPDAEAAGSLLLGGGPLTIRGQVVNQSGGVVPAGLEVLLQGFEEMEVVTAQTTVLAEDGSFSFVLLEPVEGKVFIVTLEYNGVPFGSEMVYLDELTSGSAAPLTIPIYEKTTDTGSLYADRSHVFFNFLSADRLQVVVYLLISNSADRVVAGETPDDPVLVYSLPDDAENLQFEADSAYFVITEDGFGDLMSIRPGEQQSELLFAYELPYNKKRDLELVFPLRVASGNVIIPDGLKLKSDQLTGAGEREMETGNMHLYSITELAAGDGLKLELSGFPSNVSVVSKNNWIGLVIGLGAFALVTITAGFWLHRKSQTAVSVKKEVIEQEPAETQESLLDAIIRLDAAYENGTLSAEEYQSRRTGLKERLKEMRTEGGE